jgi:hypothetical protein
MKNALLVLAILICARSVPGKGADEFKLDVEITTGERSKDSSSQTTTINVTRAAIMWEQTFGGRRGSGASPLRKKFSLSPADKRKLIALINSNDLLVTDSIELQPDTPPFNYFALSVELTLDGKKGAISIGGSRTSATIKEKKLYRNTLLLVKELYRIMSRQDKRLHLEELILEPVRR